MEYVKNVHEYKRVGLLAPASDAAVPRSLYAIRAGDQRSLPGYKIGPRVLGHYVLNVVTDGVGWFKSPDRLDRAATGDLYCIFPHTPSSHWTDDQQLLQHAWVACQGEEVPRILQAIGLSPDRPLLALGPKCKPLTQVIFMIMNELSARSPGYAWRATSLLWDGFAALAAGAVPEPSSAEALIKRAAKYLELHYAEISSIAQVADDLGVSRGYFATQFKRIMCESPSRYLINVRLQAASRFLKETDMTAKEIAYSVGYADEAYFSRAFTQAFRMTPIRYRKATVSG